MNRNVFFVLLMTMAIVLANAGAAEAQAKPEAPQGQTEGAQAKTEALQGQTQGEAKAAEAAQGQTDETQAQTEEDAKLKSVPGGKALGMSILGNQEAPKALVIVPWRQSELGNVLGISPELDDSRLPVDKEVFMRMLSYYEIRSGTARPGSAPTERNAAQPAAATQRRKQ
jgi:hypothetical protein